MNPNDVLAGLNLLIATAWLAWAGLFLWSYIAERPAKGSSRLFLIIFGLAAIIAALDLGTTGVLRIIDQVAFPDVPHALLPDFNIFPLGITLLVVVRIVMVFVLWGGLFLVIGARSREDNG